MLKRRTFRSLWTALDIGSGQVGRGLRRSTSLINSQSAMKTVQRMIRLLHAADEGNGNGNGGGSTGGTGGGGSGGPPPNGD